MDDILRNIDLIRMTKETRCEFTATKLKKIVKCVEERRGNMMRSQKGCLSQGPSHLCSKLIKEKTDDPNLSASSVGYCRLEH
ncbi:hypothetical protein SDJN02_24432, partial [Cucurbita argyrosperma subsp. argyrosperma]